MGFWLSFLPIIIYILLIILLVIGIILGVKAITTIKKVEKVVDDVNAKVESLNGLFHIIDFTTDKLVTMVDRIVDGFSTLGAKIFMRNKHNNIEEEKKDE